jgi:hypothetical protein
LYSEREIEREKERKYREKKKFIIPFLDKTTLPSKKDKKNFFFWDQGPGLRCPWYQGSHLKGCLL